MGRVLQDDRHPDILMIKHNIALIHVKTGKLNDALQEFENMFEQLSSLLGKDNLTVAKLMLDISGVLLIKEEYERAKDLCYHCKQTFKKLNLPPNHLYVRQAGFTWKRIMEKTPKKAS